jgi:mono/diheme cytochrome c family protein
MIDRARTRRAAPAWAAIAAGLCVSLGGAERLAGQVPGGPLASTDGRTVFQEACAGCHGPGAIVVQRKMADGWREAVYKMISRGAQVLPGEVDPLVGYLTATYGPDSPVPTSRAGAGTTALPSGGGRELLVGRCGRCHAVSLPTSLRKSRAEWGETVARMRSLGAGLSDPETDTLLTYLTTNFGSS